MKSNRDVWAKANIMYQLSNDTAVLLSHSCHYLYFYMHYFKFLSVVLVSVSMAVSVSVSVSERESKRVTHVIVFYVSCVTLQDLNQAFVQWS